MTQQKWRDTTADLPPRNVWQSMLRGFFGACPHCGKRGLFRAYLKVADHCPHCGEAFYHQRADDAPAYFVIVIVGHIVVPLALSVEFALGPPYWVHILLWGPLTVLLALGLLQSVKGTLVGLQWANYMHGFDPSSPEYEPEAPAAITPKASPTP